MELLGQALDIFLHLDVHLTTWAGVMGAWLYVLLFIVIFCETGLVVTPFLPGDSLLFACGALAAVEGSPVSLNTQGDGLLAHLTSLGSRRGILWEGRDAIN